VRECSVMGLKEIELAVLAGASACLGILTLMYEQPLAAVVFAELAFSTAIVGTLCRQA